jgi:hypothetical protein
VLCFLVHLCEVCSIQPAWAPLLSDQDVANKISQRLQTFAWEPPLHHVKGRQDAHNAYWGLPLDAQLNVDADTKAGTYQCIDPAQRLIIPRLPSIPVQLHITSNVICTHLKHRIHEVMTVPAYIKYVAQQFKWDPMVSQRVA